MVVVLREREGRTLPFVVRREAEGVSIARKRIVLGTELHADEGPHWDALEAFYSAAACAACDWAGDMSRSRRKTPIIGLCADTDKPFKVREHRRQRRAVAVALRIGADCPHPKEFGNTWASCKDGKMHLGSDAEARWMRK